MVVVCRVQQRMIMHSVAVLLFLWSFTTNGFLGSKVTGNGKSSPEKNKATLQLRLDRHNPGHGPKGASIERFGSSSPGVPTPPTQGTATVPQEEEFSPFETEALHTSNEFRRIHDATPMRLNKIMCQEAAKRAARIAETGHVEREFPEGQGESIYFNIHRKGQEEMTAKEVVTAWYNEVCSPGYYFEKSDPQYRAGDFTQLVWNSSTELGIGKAEANRFGRKTTYFVARFKPQGNVVDEYHENVLKGSFERSEYCKQ